MLSSLPSAGTARSWRTPEHPYYARILTVFNEATGPLRAKKDWIRCSWSISITHRIILGTPRLGRERGDLRFADSENIVAVAEPEGMGDEYPNEVIVLGTGEGRAMKRAQMHRYDGRLRRVVTVVVVHF